MSWRWRVLSASVPGASHRKTGVVNQDSINSSQQPHTGLPLVLAVSDGHGSSACPRSDIGSRIAVDVAVQTLLELASDLSDSSGVSASTINRLSHEQLPQCLIRKWNDAVITHLDSHPCSASEIRNLFRNAGRLNIDRIKRNPSLAYGATLLSVLVTESYLLYLQLGDGDIIAVSDTGDTYRPVSKDERLIANETTSLCSLDAWRDVRVVFQQITDQPPALIIVSTDGYANSFKDDAGFLKVGPDLLSMVRDDGLDFVDKELASWLEEASNVGSGDDCTMGIICRVH